MVLPHGVEVKIFKFGNTALESKSSNLASSL